MVSKSLMTIGVVALTAGGAFAQSQTGQQQANPAQAPVREQVGPEQVGSGECATRMQEVSGGEYFTGETAAYRQHLGVLSSLRDSAMQLQAQGLDEACLQVVDAMETAIASFQDENGQNDTGTGITAARDDITREQLAERLVPLDSSEMPINTARLEGTDLYSMEGEDIGNVEGFLMAQGKPTHMIVSHGGFWDIGDNDVAIPLDIVRWDPEWHAFFAPLTDEQLDDAPDYDESAWDGSSNDQFYQALRG